MSRYIKRSCIGLAVVVLGLFWAPTASAADVSVRLTAEAPCQQRVEAFGYWGWKKCDTTQRTCDFNLDDRDDESWVVGPDRTIWHAWPGSGRWREMPNNGRADDVYDCYLSDNGHRVVEVAVNGHGRWYSWRDNTGVWHGWYPA